MAHLVTKPYVIEFLEVLTGVADEEDHEKLVLEDFYVKHLSENVRAKTLQELEVRKKTGAYVMAIKTGDAPFKFNPGPGTMLQKEDVLIILGNKTSITKFEDVYKG